MNSYTVVERPGVDSIYKQIDTNLKVNRRLKLSIEVGTDGSTSFSSRRPDGIIQSVLFDLDQESFDDLIQYLDLAKQLHNEYNDIKNDLSEILNDYDGDSTDTRISSDDLKVTEYTPDGVSTIVYKDGIIDPSNIIFSDNI